MIGYKAMDYDMTCRDFQYEIGKNYKNDADYLEPCTDTGFHFCEKLEDVFTYYNCRTSRIFEVQSGDNVVTANDKSITDEITIIRELSTQEILERCAESWKSGPFLHFYKQKLEFEKLLADGKESVILDQCLTYDADTVTKYLTVQLFGQLGKLDVIHTLMNNNKDNRLQQFIVKILSMNDDVESVKTLIDFDSPNVRMQVLKELLKHGEYDLIKSKMTDKSWYIRELVVKLLEKLGDVESIQQMITDKNQTVRRQVVKSLRRLNDLESIQNVRTMTRNTCDRELKYEIVYALEQFRDAESLRDMAFDADSRVAKSAVLSLENLNALEQLEQLAWDDDVRYLIHKQVLHALDIVNKRLGNRCDS